MLMEVKLSKKAKTKKKRRRIVAAPCLLRKGDGKKLISFSMCVRRVYNECILGFWATLDAMGMSIFPISALISRFEHIDMVAFSFLCCEERRVMGTCNCPT